MYLPENNRIKYTNFRSDFLDINAIIPYENNARHNEKAIPEVAESIRKYGFHGKILLVSPENPVIVNGHTRVAAAKSLGWSEFPDEFIEFCSENMTEEEIKAFRLDDNRTGAIATWDVAKLKREIKSIKRVDMSKFTDKWKSKERFYGAEILRNDLEWNLRLVSRKDCTGRLEFPTMQPCNVKPTDLIGFNYAKSAKEFNCGIHFCIDDYQFERVWRKPEQYVELLKQFECVVTPDFSVYTDMPYPMKLWNLYRSRALGHYWQSEGLNVVPNVTFSDETSFSYCYEGLPKGGTIFLSTVGIEKNKEASEIGVKAIDLALKKLKPTRVLLLGNAPNTDFGDIEVIRYKAAGFRSNK